MKNYFEADMTHVLSLEQLLKTENLAEFGLKTQGLVELYKLLSSCNFSEMGIWYPVSVPPFFAADAATDLETSKEELQQHYRRLTYRFKKPRIILARSSDPKEMPGRFETHSSLYLPSSPQQSFENWLRAAHRVMDSGARAVNGQPLVGEFEDEVYDTPQGKTRRIKSFGLHNSSFFGRSHSVIRGNYPAFTVAFGLATKIARGDDDVCLIEENVDGIEYVSLDNDYYRSSYARHNQDDFDVITLEKPEKITKVSSAYGLPTTLFQKERVELPFAPEVLGSDKKGNYGFRLNHLFDLLKYLAQNMQTHAEVEGCVNQKGVYFWQLRGYEVPQRNFQKLTDVPSERLLLWSANNSLGFNQFSGDLIVSSELSDYEQGTIFAYTDMGYMSPSQFSKFSQFVFPKMSVGSAHEAAHSFGYTAQLLVDLEKLGVEAIAIGETDDIKLTDLLELPESPRVKKIGNRGVRISNVAVECNGYDAQIYLN